ncbi:snurportin-1 [Odontomachus brunneus]|uniref:snurportin-1 n=1 Tax=Odontomachus brunneus TaxID=486640 RepID=UPI0013F297A6|nr:snurportin-1 [Odontomachus brunneus]
MEEKTYNNEITMEEEVYNNIIMEDEAIKEVMEEEIEDIKNIHEEKMNIRKLFHKTPIKRYDYRLEYDYESPQDERRRVLLKHQKKSREDTVNTARGILQIFSKITQRRNLRVMLSEWMLDIPEKFTEEWFMIPCPVGRRILLVASEGITKAYNKTGQRVSIFRSALPGGNHKYRKSQYTIIDCIWMDSQKTYYVLDVLTWASLPTMLCEAECRRFLVNSHLHDIEELKEADHKINKYSILPLPHVYCNTDLSKALTQCDQYPLDGLLFYHRNGYYKFGRSPLVVWLKPFMLPEVLGIFVPSPHDEKPDGYIDYKHYICQHTQTEHRKKFFQDYFQIAMECT